MYIPWDAPLVLHMAKLLMVSIVGATAFSFPFNPKKKVGSFYYITLIQLEDVMAILYPK